MMPRTVVLDPALTLHARVAVAGLCHPRPRPCHRGAAVDHADAAGRRGGARRHRPHARALPAWAGRAAEPGGACRCQVASWLCSYGLSSRGPQGSGDDGPQPCHRPCAGRQLRRAALLLHPVMMPAILRWSRPRLRRQRQLAQALGRPALPTAEALAELVKSLGCPRRCATSASRKASSRDDRPHQHARALHPAATRAR